jgi:hypothetical protein
MGGYNRFLYGDFLNNFKATTEEKCSCSVAVGVFSEDNLERKKEKQRG